MTLRTATTLVLVALALGACRKKPVPAGPGPETSDSLSEQQRADSLEMEERRRADAERAERERLERERAALEAETAGARAALTETIFFEFDSDELTSRAEETLQRKAAVLRANPDVRLRIEGHADQRGSTEYNLALGQRRAESVRAWFGSYGLDTGRFTTVSYGKERPLADGEGEGAWARNRRAEFAVTGGQITAVPREIR